MKNNFYLKFMSELQSISNNKNLITHNENLITQEQTTDKEIALVLEKTNTSFLETLYKNPWIVWKVVRILTWKKTSPAELVDILAEKRYKLMTIVWEESVNDSKYLKNWSTDL